MARNRTNKQKADLMEKIQASYLAGVPYRQFCEHYGISKTTYYVYLDKCMKSIKANFIDKQERIVGYFIGSALDRIGKLKRRAILIEQQTQDKAGFSDLPLLKEIHAQEMALFDRLQSMGAIPKAESEMALIGGAQASPIDEMIANARKRIADRKGGDTG